MNPMSHGSSNSRNVEEPAPVHRGENTDPVEYMEHFERAASCNSWAKDMKLLQFAAFLTGYAYQWYKANTANRDRQRLPDWT